MIFGTVIPHPLTICLELVIYFTLLGLAAALYGLCITPAEFKARLGEFSHYCPVNLAQNELVDCSHEHSLKYSAEFRYM